MKINALGFLVGAFGLSGCGHTLDDFNQPPKISPVVKSRRPIMEETVDVDQYFPAVRQDGAELAQASLWNHGPDSLLGDRRATGLGDILTVVVSIDEQAQMDNSTEIERQAQEEVSVPAFLGVGTLAQRILPGGAGLDQAINVSSSSSTEGDGRILRRERITLRVAATVRRVLPNGYLLIAGSQEVRVNNELRDLQVTGIIRTQDITRTNEITYDKIAEARITYGGRGVASSVQDQRYGQKILDKIIPF